MKLKVKGNRISPETKRLPGMQSLSYFQRLRNLGIESLEQRRIRNDLLFAYKIIFLACRHQHVGFLYNEGKRK